MGASSKRQTGFLLPLASLPGGHGVGDMGPSARAWIETLKETGASLWQICPLSTLGFGNSPYQAGSTLAGHYLYISLEDLVREGFLPQTDFPVESPFSAGRVYYQEASLFKLKALQDSWRHFQTSPPEGAAEAFASFRRTEEEWLLPHALFFVLKDQYGGAPWWEWKAEHQRLSSQTRNQLLKIYEDRILFHQYLQFLFFHQWFRLRRHAEDHQVRIIGDVSFYAAHDSVDVWSRQREFTLKKNGRRALQAGVPPDRFNAKGQAWGAPLYEWSVMKKNGYAWWMKRIQSAMALYDFVRLDHFSGFFSSFAVHGEASHGQFGKWKKGPGKELIRAFLKRFDAARFIVEDLGIHAEDIQASLKMFGLTGTRLIQYAFDSGSGSEGNRLYRVEADTALYTGTHDNPSLKAWLSGMKEKGKEGGWTTNDLAFYCGEDEQGLSWSLIRMGMESSARFFILPLADAAGLGEGARINTPGKDMGNWEWRAPDDFLSRAQIEKTLSLNRTFGRASHR